MANPQSMADWKFKSKHVQPGQLGREAGVDGNNYVSAESIVLCAVLPSSDPKIDTIGSDQLFPIGVMQNAGFNQQKQINQLYEIGSRLPFFIPGRTLIQLNMTRVVFNGDSLMAALYHADGKELGSAPAESPGAILTAGGIAERRFYMNLASELFNRGIDIALVIRDSEDEASGAIIFRECIIQSHGMGISSNQTVVAENISLRSKKLEGINVSVA
jgi:hypothetical protein